MLELVKFIKENPDWEEQLQKEPYYLNIQRDPYNRNFILFKYNQIKTDFSYKLCREARGIILDESQNFKVMRLAFEKFFNYEEPFAAQIDWNHAIGTEKIDGSIISLWFDGHNWRISTNGMIDAFRAELADKTKYQNFGDLFEAAAEKSGLNYKELNTNYCYTFELVSPYNRVVIPYSEEKLFHLSTRDMFTLKEVNEDIGICKPKEYHLNNKADYCELVSQLDETHEGIVVRDSSGNRVKIKTLTYFTMHRLQNNGRFNVEYVVDLIRMNDTDEVLSYFPERRESFEKIKSQLTAIDEKVAKIQQEVWKIKDQIVSENPKKEFALRVKENPLAYLYFLAYDEKLLTEIKNFSTKKLISIFNIKF